MLQLVAGLALFIGAHLFSSIARGGRSAIAGKIGEMGYKGLMAILSLGGLYLIVQGWQAAGAGDARPRADGAEGGPRGGDTV